MTALLGVTFVVIFIQALLRGAPGGALPRPIRRPSRCSWRDRDLRHRDVSWHVRLRLLAYLPEKVSDRPRSGVFLAAPSAGVLRHPRAYLTVQLPHADSTWPPSATWRASWALPVMAVSLIGSDVATLHRDARSLSS